MSVLDNNEIYWMFLSCVDNLSNTRVDSLLNALGSAEEIYRADEAVLRSVPDISEEPVNNILKCRARFEPQRMYEELAARGISYVSRQHPDFPARLHKLINVPNGLFYKGRLPDPDRPAIAVVGSRNCSNYGRDISIMFGKGLAAAGVDVISGMAAGVDGYSHRGALNGGGETYAVLGTGVDVCFPRSNIDIYSRIPEHGGVISELAPGTPGKAYNFPRRNRLIAGLSDGVLVVEAGERSGTWITVDMGLEQGKEIFVIPGRIGDELSFGCNRLIRQGAHLVLSPADIIAELAPHYGFGVDRPGYGDPINRPDRDVNGSRRLNNSERCVLKCLDTYPRSIDMLCNMSQLSATEVMTALTILELKGFCEQIGAANYIKRII